MQDGSLIPSFGRARRDPALAVLEGFHPLKHALRFGAEVLEVACRDARELDALAARLAPDLREQIGALARPVPAAIFAKLSPFTPATGVIAVARRPRAASETLLTDARAAPVVLLEDPRDLGNLGACVRVAAAADAAGVLSSGGHDPWHPDALRGAAGLHFALPVLHLEALDALSPGGRPLVALEPDAPPLLPEELSPRSVLAFGSERSGLSAQLRERAEAAFSIPMRAGVSSLNLATAVAAVLFAWRLQAHAHARAAPQRDLP